MDALILAGGLGTRLRSVVSDRAKPVALVRDQPFLCQMMRHLVRSGCVSRFTVCVGHMAETVESALGTRIGKVPIRFSVEHEPLGTGGALRLAVKRFDLKGPLLVLNGDTYLGFNLERMLAGFDKRGADFEVALARVASTSRYGRVDLSGDRITTFHEKGPGGQGWINAGVYLVSRSGARLLHQAPARCSLERDIFPTSLHAGRLQGYRSRSTFIDIGIPEDYLRAQTIFA